MNKPGLRPTESEKSLHQSNKALDRVHQLEKRVKELEDYIFEEKVKSEIKIPSIDKLSEEIDRRKDLIEKLNLSGNPSDWVMASAQEIVMHGLIEAKQIISSGTEEPIPQDILDEMDADMEESAMGQGEIESCLTHWSNKYIIRRR